MQKDVVPFLKWPGGKRWFVAKYHDYFPRKINRYIEPFLGGGSVYFRLQPKNALLSDINTELILLYKVMRDNPSELKNLLKHHQLNHSKEYYYEIRNQDPDDELLKAGRFLYLNRTCFNGMYRVNRSGRFNVPIGSKHFFTFDLELFDIYSEILRSADIQSKDFSEVINQAAKGDFIFVDPPYTIAHNQNSFIKYNEKLFTWEDQIRLVKELCVARENGAIILATNANYNLLKELYESNGFFTRVLVRYSSIAGKPEGRGRKKELLISSSPFRRE